MFEKCEKYTTVTGARIQGCLSEPQGWVTPSREVVLMHPDDPLRLVLLLHTNITWLPGAITTGYNIRQYCNHRYNWEETY